MKLPRPLYLFTAFWVLIGLVSCLRAGYSVAIGKEKGNEDKKTMTTTLELQSQLMSFAETAANRLTQALDDIEQFGVPSRVRYIVLGDTVSAISSALTIAVQPNPEIALLDMTVLITLGRLIYEGNYLSDLGHRVKPMVDAYRKLEKDIWNITDQIISIEQQQELRKLITTWRRENPKQLVFAYIRLSSFARERGRSTLPTGVQSGTFFPSVTEASEEIEQTRLFAERAFFLASRMLQLTDMYTDLAVTRLSVNPAVQQALADLNTFTSASERLTIAAEKLPNQIVTERQNIIKELEYQDGRLRALMAEFRQTLEKGNELVSAINTTVKTADPLVAQLTAESESDTDYVELALKVKEAAQELTVLFNSIEQFMATYNQEGTLLPAIKALRQTESEVEALITHGFLLAAGLILFFFITLFVYRVAAKRLLDKSKSGPERG